MEQPTEERLALSPPNAPSRKGRMNGGGDPREMAQKSAEARRAKARRRAETAQLDTLTIRQRLAHELNERKSAIPAVLDALLAKAMMGSTQASAELRHWYDQGLGRPEAASLLTGDESTPYQDMTPEERARLRAGVIKRISELEAQEASVDAASGA